MRASVCYVYVADPLTRHRYATENGLMDGPCAQGCHVLASAVCLHPASPLSFTHNLTHFIHPRSPEKKLMKTTAAHDKHLAPFFFQEFTFLNFAGWVCVSGSAWHKHLHYQTKCFPHLPSVTSLCRTIRAEQRCHLTIHLQPLIPRDSVTNVTRDYFTEAEVHRGAQSCLRWYTFCLTTRPLDELNSRRSLSHPGLLGFSDKQLNKQMRLSPWSQSIRSVVGVEPVFDPSSDHTRMFAGFIWRQNWKWAVPSLIIPHFHFTQPMKVRQVRAEPGSWSVTCDVRLQRTDSLSSEYT